MKDAKLLYSIMVDGRLVARIFSDVSRKIPLVTYINATSILSLVMNQGVFLTLTG